jgi:release factor glutamine methyltransferase
MATRSNSHAGENSRTRSVRATLKEAMSGLRADSVPSHTLAAELLLMHVLGRDRTWLYSNPEAQIAASDAERYFAFVARRCAGEPTQYLTGKQEFWGLDFEVTPAVLIPRPETEHVIEVSLELLGPRGFTIRLDTGAPTPALRIADVGTGSGCLAVALAHDLPHAQVFATDISPAALAVASRNAARHGVSDRISFLETNLLDALSRKPAPFDLIVSNPPYVALSDAATLPREVRDYEPHAALFGGPTGIEMYARLIEQAAGLLRAGGILVLELGYNSADHVRAIVGSQSYWTGIAVTNDLAGIPRVLSASRA